MSNRLIIIFMACSLLIQACATTRVETQLIPGKEIAAKLIEQREIDSKIVLEEITPLSVRLFRRVSKVDLTSTESQAIKEIRRETTTYNCSSTTYREYISIMVVNLAVPLLYELVTNFDILHDLCDKNPPSYVIETVATDKTLSRESYDKDKIVISEIPLAGESVALQLDGKNFKAITSAAGIATFSRAEVAPLLNMENDLTANYQYNDFKLATRLSGKDPSATASAANPSAGPQQSGEASAVIASALAGADIAATVQPLPYPHPEGVGILSAFLPLTAGGGEGDGVMWLTVGNVAANRFTADAADILPAETDSMDMSGGHQEAKSTVAGENEAAVKIGAESKADRPKTGEWKIVLHVKFDTNKATIKKEYYSRLKEIGEALKGNEQLTGVIEGHTDNVGSRELNQKISILRAEAVAQHLIKTFAIPAERLKVEGYGMSRPIAANSSPNGRAKNRRIEAKFKELR